MSNWIKGAIKRPGAFRAKAKDAGIGTAEDARHVLAKGSWASERTKRQTTLALTLGRLRNRIADAAASCAGTLPGAMANTGWTLLRSASYAGQADPASRGSFAGASEALRNTGWTDEARAASLAVRQAKAQKRLARERMFAEQAERGGDDFLENWYPRGRDGRSEDPHYGKPSREAPYGYVEGTNTPRKEPLYDRDGRPIIPRPWEDWHGRVKTGMWPFQIDLSASRDIAYLRRAEAAEKLWGRFGRKKRWMDENPGATEADWEKHDREQLAAWKKKQREEDAGATGAGEAESELGLDNRAAAAAATPSGVATLILNREFRLPADGWYQVAPLGEFIHTAAGVVQVVDQAACEAMVARFREEAGIQPVDTLTAERFAGLLIDFDHFSLDGEKRSEAAGWITALEARPEVSGVGGQVSGAGAAGAASSGLWAKIRWSDLGEEAVKGGRYRFLSPVWARKDCEDLGLVEGQTLARVRPVRLLNAAVTNDPNLKGMVPLSNASTSLSAGASAELSAGAQRFKWVLGESPDGRHCPSCVALAGQVHAMGEWEAAGVLPQAGGLYCQGNCHCRLEATNEAATGDLLAGPLRRKKEDAVGNGTGAVGDPKSAAGEVATLANVGWTDRARAASLAVRRAKAAARKGSGAGPERKKTPRGTPEERMKSAFREKHGRDPETDAEWAEAEGLAGIPERERARGAPAPLAKSDGGKPGVFAPPLPRPERRPPLYMPRPVPKPRPRRKAPAPRLPVPIPVAMNAVALAKRRRRAGHLLIPGLE